MLCDELESYRTDFNKLFSWFSGSLFALAYLFCLLMIHPTLFNSLVYLLWIMMCFGIPATAKYMINNIDYQKIGKGYA